MKTTLLLFLFALSYTGFAQDISYSIVPKYACENSTHDIVITVVNDKQTIPASLNYTVNLNVKNNSGTTVKTFSQTYSDGFTKGTTKTYTLSAVAFAEASTWTIEGSVVVAIVGTFPVPSQDYFVKAVPVLTIIANNKDLSTTTNIDGYSVRYYLDGDYGNIINESTTGNYTALVDGIYTAKAINYVYISSVLNTCESASPSNGVPIISTGIEESQSTSISVYPNPMASTLTISSGIPDELTYELYDRTGTLLRTSAFKQVDHVNVSELKAGVYMLVVKNKEEKIASYKLVK